VRIEFFCFSKVIDGEAAKGGLGLEHMRNQFN
jgi:hypothetical protein